MKKWNIQIINETNDGYIVMAPNGDTQFMTKKDYKTYLNNRNK